MPANSRCDLIQRLKGLNKSNTRVLATDSCLISIITNYFPSYLFQNNFFITKQLFRVAIFEKDSLIHYSYLVPWSSLKQPHIQGRSFWKSASELWVIVSNDAVIICLQNLTDTSLKSCYYLIQPRNICCWNIAIK